MAFHDSVSEIKRCPAAKDIPTKSLANKLGIANKYGLHIAQFQRVNPPISLTQTGKCFVRRFTVNPRQVTKIW